MAQILWRPIIDELDRQMFVFACEEIPGWEPVDGWKGTDIEDPDVMYSLETARRGSELRGLVHKFARFKESRAIALPVPMPSEIAEEAAGHLGFSRFKLKPVENSPSQSVWIIPED